MNNPWIKAARLRTLPLAISGILLGWSVAFPFANLAENHEHMYQSTNNPLLVLCLAILTAVLLQITSNYANDYGDFEKGTDANAGRTDRMLTTGEISPTSMKRALVLLSFTTLGVGLLLLHVSGVFSDFRGWLLLSIGIASIGASILYTVGKNAYGYLGLGDVFVFVFFGLVTVLGMSVLLNVNIGWIQIAAAIGIGSFSAAVLNINNYRDIESDRFKNKHTVAVMLGAKKTLTYQGFLLLFGVLGTTVSFVIFQFEYFHWQSWFKAEMAYSFGLFFPIVALINQQYIELKSLQPGQRELINPLLKKLSLTIFSACLLYSILVSFIVS